MEGWIKLHRVLSENKLWTCEPFTRGQAWVDLIMLANHEYGYFYLRDHKIEVKRGQVGWSILRLSKRWKWSRSKTKKFLNDLEKEQQVEQQQSHSTSIVTIVNYDKYQEKEQQVEQQKDNRKTTERQQKDTNKNEKNEKNEKKYKNFLLSEIKISEHPGLKKEYFDIAIAFRDLFKSKLIEAGASTNIIDKAKGTWIDDARLMLESDGYNKDDLREIFCFLRDEIPDRNGFTWSSNILSISKLRKQIPKLKLKLKDGANKSNHKEATSWNELAEVVKKSFEEAE